ncbi:hypothetical protein SAMN05445850_8585 [Paraburkholderia tuberum]|uniref:Uncharacterized protein n=1 Tax=Paraburkholderia tuberum TaxID=157910 RepID=A0A1H1KL28_9BURK|nr:hypothetical protein SAMN05445850_8585 [Paraburkholderia tuberum]
MADACPHESGHAAVAGMAATYGKHGGGHGLRTAGRGDVSSQVTPVTSAKSPASSNRPEQGEHHAG